MLPVLPVLGPEVVGVETATNQAGNHGTVRLLDFSLLVRTPNQVLILIRNVQDRQLAPEVCTIIGSVTDIVYSQWPCGTIN